MLGHVILRDALHCTPPPHSVTHALSHACVRACTHAYPHTHDRSSGSTAGASATWSRPKCPIERWQHACNGRGPRCVCTGVYSRSLNIRTRVCACARRDKRSTHTHTHTHTHASRRGREDDVTGGMPCATRTPCGAVTDVGGTVDPHTHKKITFSHARARARTHTHTHTSGAVADGRGAGKPEANRGRPQGH